MKDIFLTFPEPLRKQILLQCAGGGFGIAIPAQELPVTESWDAICEALIHSDFRGAHCCDDGIIIEIEQ